MSYDIRFTEAKLNSLILHKVGSKAANEGVLAAKQPVQVHSPELREVLLQYFLNSFSTEELYRFDHGSDLDMNEVYTYCRYLFQDPENQFQEQSVQMLQHLYEQSEHAKIKAGELYVALFDDIIFEDELLQAIGIFKAETKDTYLRLKLNEENQFVLEYEQGTSVAKLDKGCLVFRSQEEEGFRVLVVDAKGGEAKYWRDSFLQVTQVRDDALRTRDYLQMCKSFAKNVLEEEVDDKQEQVHFVNKSLEYFQTRENFDFDEFKDEVFEDTPQRAERFEHFKRDYEERQGIQLNPEEEGFFIAAPVVQKLKRSLRTNISLDTGLEIKVANVQAEEFLEKGFDEERGMGYYKVYFNTEK